jgi:hypothetical protein
MPDAEMRLGVWAVSAVSGLEHLIPDQPHGRADRHDGADRNDGADRHEPASRHPVETGLAAEPGQALCGARPPLAALTEPAWRECPACRYWIEVLLSQHRYRTGAGRGWLRARRFTPAAGYDRWPHHRAGGRSAS